MSATTNSRPHVGLSSVEVDLRELTRESERALERIRPWVERTPVVRLPWLDVQGVREVWAKLECWQRTGSFKARGAFAALTGSVAGQLSVTASAGNHGLAMAEAARDLDRQVRVFVPINASELKVRRISATGADVVPAGRDLAEATLAARQDAARRGVPFVSPYADWTVAAGQGTCLIEALEDHGRFDTVIVPVGGGGLLAGAGAVLSVRSPQTRLIGTHPQTFGRTFDGPSALRQQLSQTVLPSHADGLAVQHLWPSPLDDILEHLLHDVRQVSESQILLALYTALHEQSLLLEGAAAIALAPLLTEPASSDPVEGRVLVVLSGGNISTNTLGKALVAPVTDKQTRSRLGLRGHLAVLDSLAPSTTAAPPANDRPSSDRESHDAVAHESDRVFGPESWGSLELRAAAGSFRQTRAELDLDDAGPADQLHEQLLGLAAEVARDLVPRSGHLPASQSEDLARLLLQLRELVAIGPEWASPAYDQSGRVNFYDPAFQSAGGVNYARYGTSAVRDLELALGAMLGLEAPGHELLLTSSGMAAYQVIEALLLRHVLQPGDVIARAPYVYFETAEQVVSLPYFRHVRAAGYDLDDLIHTCEAADARVLFVDPVANIAGLPSVDLEELTRRVAGRCGWADRWLIVDGTMISGGLDLTRFTGGPAGPHLLYYESASKYAQFGLDLQMAGLCVVPAGQAQLARTMRRNCGAILYPGAVARFPRAGREQFLRRMRLMTHNADLLARLLDADQRLHGHLDVGHVADWERNHWTHGGAVITLGFTQDGLNNRDGLDALIDACLRRARTERVPLVKGLSFGFSTTRISAASAMAQDSDPFLRLSLGTGPEDEIRALAHVVGDAVTDYLSTFDTPDSLGGER